MSDLLGLALTLIGTPARRRSSSDVVVLAAASTFAALTVAAALICAAAALWIGLHPIAGPIGAPLIVAAVLLVLALVASALAHRALRPRPAPAPTTVGSTESLLAEAAGLVAAHKIPVLLAAVLAGMVAGSRDK